VTPFSRRVPAAPQALAELRSQLDGWLAAAGVAGQDAFDAVAAASEAASNASRVSRSWMSRSTAPATS
jgi:anti-sigma regulatory factor (Ser/Thr protein kinase)